MPDESSPRSQDRPQKRRTLDLRWGAPAEVPVGLGKVVKEVVMASFSGETWLSMMVNDD